MKTNSLKTIDNFINNKELSFEILSNHAAANVVGGGWVYKVVKKIVQAVRDGAVYETVVYVGTWVYENVDPKPTKHDLERIEAGYTHYGGRQPWL